MTLRTPKPSNPEEARRAIAEAQQTIDSAQAKIGDANSTIEAARQVIHHERVRELNTLLKKHNLEGHPDIDAARQRLSRQIKQLQEANGLVGRHTRCVRTFKKKLAERQDWLQESTAKQVEAEAKKRQLEDEVERIKAQVLKQAIGHDVLEGKQGDDPEDQKEVA